MQLVKMKKNESSSIISHHDTDSMMLCRPIRGGFGKIMGMCGLKAFLKASWNAWHL